MMKRLLTTTSAVGLVLSGPALAQSLVDRLVSEYQARDFSYIEVYQGPTQIKVEATQGTRTIEVIYDAATGAILGSEVELADADDMRRRGVEFNREDRDFTMDDDDDDDGYDDDDDDDDDRGGDDDDDDDDDDRGRDDDDDDDRGGDDDDDGDDGDDDGDDD